MTVLVAIPYWRCAEYVEQAVRSALDQTYRDIAVLVAGDGEEPPIRSWDQRVRTVTFPANRGVHFTEQAMLMGSPFEWYATWGADDWADPEYVESLLALGARANGSAAIWQHYPDGEALVKRDHAHVEFGVFDAALLRSIGGYAVERRCGMDTLLYENMLPNVAPIAWMDEPRIHKRIRAGSLTQDPETGFGSAYRTESVWHIRDVLARCTQIGWADRDGIRRYRESLVPGELRGELEDRVAVVQAALS